MNKNLPFYRTVGYVDDGCSAYQCMCCKSGWTGRQMSHILYCPYCGTAVDHKKTRPTDKPRWEWDRWGEDRMPFELHDKVHARPAPGLYQMWVFEYRYKWAGQDWEEWTFDSQICDKQCTHQLARSWLAHCRMRGMKEEDSPFQMEWRMRRLNKEQLATYIRRGRH